MLEFLVGHLCSGALQANAVTFVVQQYMKLVQGNMVATHVDTKQETMLVARVWVGIVNRAADIEGRVKRRRTEIYADCVHANMSPAQINLFSSAKSATRLLHEISVQLLNF